MQRVEANRDIDLDVVEPLGGAGRGGRSLPDLLSAGKRLSGSGVSTFNFAGEQTEEPSVIGWMPSAQLYFRDPEGHLLELITPLDVEPDPSFIGPLHSWLRRDGRPDAPAAGDDRSRG